MSPDFETTIRHQSPFCIVFRRVVGHPRRYFTFVPCMLGKLAFIGVSLSNTYVSHQTLTICTTSNYLRINESNSSDRNDLLQTILHDDTCCDDFVRCQTASKKLNYLLTFYTVHACKHCWQLHISIYAAASVCWQTFNPTHAHSMSHCNNSQKLAEYRLIWL